MPNSDIATTRESTPSPTRADRFSGGGGMRCVDTSASEHIPILMEMVQSLSRATDPEEVLRAFAWGLQELYGHRSFISLSTRGLGPGEYRITRMMLDQNVDNFAVNDPFTRHHNLPIHQGGFLGELIRMPHPELIHHLEVSDDPVLGEALSPFGSLMAIPLFDQGEALNWGIMLDHDPEGFTIEQLEQTILRFNMVGGRVKSTLIANELTEANRQIRKDMDRIASIQRSLLPSAMPSIPGLTLAARYEAFDAAGGDYYDFIPLPGEGPPVAPAEIVGSESLSQEPAAEPWVMVVADVSGHGPAAAVIMAMLHAILHAYPHTPSGPAEMLEHLNRHLCQKRIESSFVTAFLAIYDPVSRSFKYARAGHNPPLLKNSGSGGAVERLDRVGGVPLGIIDDATYQETTITLDPEQSVVFYTDGITEAKDVVGDMFGVEGIERALIQCTGDPECVMDSVMNAVRGHESGLRPNDDQTLVAMKVGG